MKLNNLLILIFVWFFSFHYPVDACTKGNINLTGVSQKVPMVYDAKNGNNVSQTFSIRYRGSGGSYFITVSSGNAKGVNRRALQSLGGDFLDYEIFDGSDSRKIIKEITSNPGGNEVISGVLSDSPGWRSVKISYLLHVKPNQSIPSLNYTDSVVMCLYWGTPKHAELMDTKIILFWIHVPRRIDISLVETGGAFNPKITSRSLSFGNLKDGKTLSCDLLVRTNHSFSIFLLSESSGWMVNTDPSDDSLVPYTLKLNGIPVDLSKKCPIPLPVKTCSPHRFTHRLPIQVTIGAVGTASEGAYSDSIMICVRSK